MTVWKRVSWKCTAGVMKIRTRRCRPGVLLLSADLSGGVVIFLPVCHFPLILSWLCGGSR